jgi:hypothetical protein
MLLDALKKRLHDEVTPKEASGSRNYPMHFGGFVLNLPCQ